MRWMIICPYSPAFDIRRFLRIWKTTLFLQSFGSVSRENARSRVPGEEEEAFHCGRGRGQCWMMNAECGGAGSVVEVYETESSGFVEAGVDGS